MLRTYCEVQSQGNKGDRGKKINQITDMYFQIIQSYARKHSHDAVI